MEKFYIYLTPLKTFKSLNIILYYKSKSLNQISNINRCFLISV